MTEETKNEAMLRKVRQLLAKAASTTEPGEADVFRAGADRIMTQYAIEAWQVQSGEDQTAKMPVMRNFNYDWWRDNQFRSQLQYMFREVCRHCRCYSVYEKINYGAEYTLPVVGLPSDLDWFDLLFTNLMITMIDKVDPRANTNLSVNENMARMREAGLPWAVGINRLVLAGIVPSIAEEEWEEDPYNYETGERLEKPQPDKRRRLAGNGRTHLYFSKKTYERTITNYRQWCTKTGHEQSKVSQVTFRRHFANGFAYEVSERLYRMKRETTSTYDSEHSAGSMDLVTRDIRKIVEETVYINFPDLRPHPSNCDCETCHWCHDANCQRRNCVARRDWKPVRTRARAIKEEKVDYAAMDAGREAGRVVNLSNQPSERIGGNKEIGS